MAYFQPTFTNGTSVVPCLQSDPFVTGLEILITGSNTLTVFPGAARAYATNDVMQVNSALTLNTNVIGAGGCYPHSPAQAAPTDDTAFPIYLIGDSSGTSATVGGNAPKLVIATGNNFLPPLETGASSNKFAYNIWRRIGTAYFTAGTNTMLGMTISGNDETRNYMLQLGVQAVNAGAATSLTAVDLSTGDLMCNPYFVTKIGLQAAWTPQNVANILSLAPKITATALAPIRIKASVVSVQIMQNIEMVPSFNATTLVNDVYYSTTNGGDALNLYLNGFTENLGLAAL